MNKVLITDPVSDNGIKILQDKGIEVFYHPDDNLDQIKDNLGHTNRSIRTQKDQF